MKRHALISTVDIAAFACFVLLVSTGILMEYLLPPGTGRWAAIWGMNRHQWGDIHFWIAVVFFAVLAVHLFLHWSFIAGVFKGRPRGGSRLRPALGLLALIALLALAAAPLLSPVQQAGSEPGFHAPGQGHGGGGRHGR